MRVFKCCKFLTENANGKNHRNFKILAIWLDFFKSPEAGQENKGFSILLGSQSMSLARVFNIFSVCFVWYNNAKKCKIWLLYLSTPAHHGACQSTYNPNPLSFLPHPSQPPNPKPSILSKNPIIQALIAFTISVDLTPLLLHLLPLTP